MVDATFSLVAVVGSKESGKTLLVEALTSELVRREYQVGTVKHVHHEGFTFDVEGKDTWRHAKAGAKVVVGVAPEEILVVRKIDAADSKLNNALKFLAEDDVEIVIVEGFKSLIKDDPEIAKFITARSEDEARRMVEEYENVLAVVSTSPIAGLHHIPSFRLDETEKLADEVERKHKSSAILRKLPRLNCGHCGFGSCSEHADAIRSGKSSLEKCHWLPEKAVIMVEDRKIPLNRFMQTVLRNILLGFTASLKEASLSGNETVTVTLKPD